MPAQPPDPTLIADLNALHREATAEQILAAADSRWMPRLAMACSLGLEDVLLVDLVAQLGLRPRIFLLDTGRLDQETYDTLAALRARYGLPIEVWFPRAEAVQALLTAKGPNSFYESLANRLECCRIRKVEPLSRALRGADAWITGMRRGQSSARAGVEPFEWDAANGLVKVNPLARWTLDQAWAHVRRRGVPYNRLHDLGYPSIGCAPCTRPVQQGEDPRAGRWWWELDGRKECGLHARIIKEAQP
jgi:phosphoadenosine phosphosulfate reductase